jgi:multidrug resistance protein, MATE family
MAAGGGPRKATRRTPVTEEAAPVTGLVWPVTVPLLFAEVGEAVIFATDTALLARVGTIELAAIGLADIARELWVVPVVGLAEGAQIIIARRMGQREGRAIGATFARSMALALVAGLFLGATLWALAGPVGDRLVSSGEVAGALGEFLRAAAVGLPFHGLNLVYGSLYVGVGRTRILFGATAVLAATNLVASAVLVFGLLGLPELGIAGAGLGYAIAEMATFAFFTLRTLRSPAMRELGLFGVHAPHAPSVRSLGRLAAPISLEGLVQASRWFVFFLIIERMSADALAWSNLVYACFALLVIPSDAFSETAYTLVSRAIGSGRVREMWQVIARTTTRALVVTLPFVALALVAPDLMLSVFTDDPGAMEGAEPVLRVVALTLLVVIPAEMCVAAVFGTGDTDAALGIEVLASTVLLAGAYIAAVELDLELQWVWLSLALSSLLVLPLSLAWLRSGWWRRRDI